MVFDIVFLILAEIISVEKTDLTQILRGVLITPPHLVTRADDNDSLHLRICSSTSRLFICKIERCDELCSIIRAKREISRLWRVFCSCLSFSKDSTRVWRSKTKIQIRTGQVKSEQVRSEQVRSGQNRSDTNSIYTLFSQITDTIMIFNLIFWYFHFAWFTWDWSFRVELALSRMFNQIV